MTVSVSGKVIVFYFKTCILLFFSDKLTCTAFV